MNELFVHYVLDRCRLFRCRWEWTNLFVQFRPRRIKRGCRFCLWCRLCTCCRRSPPPRGRRSRSLDCTCYDFW